MRLLASHSVTKLTVLSALSACAAAMPRFVAPPHDRSCVTKCKILCVISRTESDTINTYILTGNAAEPTMAKRKQYIDRVGQNAYHIQNTQLHSIPSVAARGICGLRWKPTHAIAWTANPYFPSAIILFRRSTERIYPYCIYSINTLTLRVTQIQQQKNMLFWNLSNIDVCLSFCAHTKSAIFGRLNYLDEPASRSSRQTIQISSTQPTQHMCVPREGLWPLCSVFNAAYV